MGIDDRSLLTLADNMMSRSKSIYTHLLAVVEGGEWNSEDWPETPWERLSVLQRFRQLNKLLLAIDLVSQKI